MNNSEKLALAVIIFLALASAFLAVSAYFQTVDVEAVPEQIRPFVSAIQIFFSAGIGFASLAFLRNIVGYVNNWLIARSKKEPSLQYDLAKFYPTVTRYLVVINGVFAALITIVPQPWNAPFAWGAAVVITVVDVVKSDLTTLLSQIFSPTVTPTGPGSPPTS